MSGTHWRCSGPATPTGSLTGCPAAGLPVVKQHKPVQRMHWAPWMKKASLGQWRPFPSPHSQRKRSSSSMATLSTANTPCLTLSSSIGISFSARLNTLATCRHGWLCLSHCELTTTRPTQVMRSWCIALDTSVFSALYCIWQGWAVERLPCSSSWRERRSFWAPENLLTYTRGSMLMLPFSATILVSLRLWQGCWPAPIRVKKMMACCSWEKRQRRLCETRYRRTFSME